LTLSTADDFVQPFYAEREFFFGYSGNLPLYALYRESPHLADLHPRFLWQLFLRELQRQREACPLGLRHYQ